MNSKFRQHEPEGRLGMRRLCVGFDTLLGWLFLSMWRRLALSCARGSTAVSYFRALRAA